MRIRIRFFTIMRIRIGSYFYLMRIRNRSFFFQWCESATTGLMVHQGSTVHSEPPLLQCESPRLILYCTILAQTPRLRSRTRSSVWWLVNDFRKDNYIVLVNHYGNCTVTTACLEIQYKELSKVNSLRQEENYTSELLQNYRTVYLYSPKLLYCSSMTACLEI